MGSKQKYKCSHCGYSVVSSGVRDLGLIRVVQSMTCEDCEVIVDVLIGMCGKDGPTGDSEYDKRLNKCPACKGTNLKPWPDDYPYPKCGNNMDELFEVMNWD